MGALANQTFVNSLAATRTMTAKGIINGIARWRDVGTATVAAQMTQSFSFKPSDNTTKQNRTQVNIRQPAVNSDGVVIRVNSINVAASVHEASTAAEIYDLFAAATYALLPSGTQCTNLALLGVESIW